MPLQYADVSAVSAGQAYYDFDADTGVTCGHIVLAEAAAAGFRSPVYLAVNMHGPTHGAGPQSSSMPFHGFDFVAAMAFWPEAYEPTSGDITYGNTVRAHWLHLAVNGTPGEDWRPVNAGNSGAVLTALLDANGTTMVQDFKRGLCSTLATMHIGKRYWWIN